GLPITVDGEKLSPVDLVQRVGAIAGNAGVGRIDLMENRVVGIKSRESYECPAAVALIAAHKDLERFTTLGAAQKVKDMLDVKFADVVYEGLWFSPLRAALDAFNIEHDKTVTGEVTLKLLKGGLRIVGRTSPFGVYNHAMSTYDRTDKFDHKAAEGFIALAGLQLAEFTRVGEQNRNRLQNKVL
ncbi:MAG: argininosuccinate synthase, partial [Polyangiaceae bacterium]